MTLTAPVPTVAAKTAISLRGVSKAFGHGGSAVVALDNINLDVAPGEFVCLVGMSGCGKTTSLNLMAGLDRPTVGEVAVHGRTALMFQEAALFPWLTVRDNVALPLRLTGMKRAQRHRRAEEILEQVHLGGQGGRRPHELSGGMRQRVAMARALAQDSHVLLMDEPFAALDAITRDVLHQELTRVWAEQGLSIVFVTHNVREAARLGQRVVLMGSRPGRIVREWHVDIPQPRTIESSGVSSLAAEITRELHQEISRHGN